MTKSKIIPLFLGTFLALGHLNAEMMRVTASVLRVRSKPVLTAPIIGSFKRGERVSVVSKSTFTQTIEGKMAPWVQLSFQGELGWAFAGFMAPEESRPADDSNLMVGEIANPMSPDYQVRHLQLLVPDTTDLPLGVSRLGGWVAVTCQSTGCHSKPAFVAITEHTPLQKFQEGTIPATYKVDSDPQAVFLVKGLDLPSHFPGTILSTAPNSGSLPIESMSFELTTFKEHARLTREPNKSSSGSNIFWSMGDKKQLIYSSEYLRLYAFSVVWEGDLNNDEVADFLVFSHTEGECSNLFYTLYVSQETSPARMDQFAHFRKEVSCSY